MIKGIDLSTYQRNVDYKKLKEDGIEFAILRIGYGKDAGQRDEMFDEHYAGCRAVGIKVGAYHYSYCTTEKNAILEAENCLKYLDGIELDLPVFYDLEDKAILNNNVDVEKIATKFCNRIFADGYDAGVYASLNWFNNYLDINELNSLGIYIWLAQWNDKITADFPVDIWQNTNNIFDSDEGERIDGDYLINESLLNNDIEPSPIIDVNICQSLAVDVIYGRYGNGEERKKALGNYYYEVQDIVNDMYEIIGG